MTDRNELIRAGAVALGALLLGAAPAPAQDADPSGPAARVAADLDRSKELFDEATRLLEKGQGSRAGPAKRARAKAAKLYVESARLRTTGDVEAYVALERAARIHARDGRARRAERTFARAAIRAFEAGRVYEAALAFTNALEVARGDAGAGDRLDSYFRQAERLGESPLLSADQRRDVRRRLGLDGSGSPSS